MTALLDNLTGAAGPLSGHTADSGHTWIDLVAGMVLDGLGHIRANLSTTPAVKSSFIPTTPNVFIQGVAKIDATPDQTVRLLIRLSDDNKCYLLQHYSGSYALYKFDGTNYVSMASPVVSSITTGDIVRGEATGTNPTRVVIKVNGVTIFDVTDSSSPYLFQGVGVGGYSGVSTGGYYWDTITADNIIISAPPDTPGLSQGFLRTSTHAEISWDSSIGATSYDVYKNGSLLVTGVTNLYYLYASHTNGDTYTVTAVNSDGESSPTSSITPTALPTFNVPDSTIVTDRPATLHDAMTNNHLANWQSLVYSLKSQHSETAGTYSRALLGETWSGSTNSLANAWATLTASRSVPGPAFGIKVTVTALQGHMMIGYGANALNGLFIRYNITNHTIELVGINAGVETSIVAPTAFTLTPTTTLLFDVCNNVYSLWQGSTLLLTEADLTGNYDLRNATKLSTWKPLVLTGHTAGTTTNSLTATVIGFSGTGMSREACPVTYRDNTPVVNGNGYYLLGADRCGPVPNSIASGEATNSVGFAIHEYDPVAGQVIDGNITVITMLDPATGLIIAAQEPKVVLDTELGGHHIWAVNWSNVTNNTFPNQPQVYYQFISGPLVGFIHMDNPTLVTIPAGMTYSYGYDVMYANGAWYAIINHLVGGQVTIAIASGSSPSNFSTLIDEDTTNHAEGGAWFPLGSRMYVVAGAHISDVGKIRVWDFTNFTNLTHLGFLSYPITSMGLAQQPTILWWNDTPQLIGFKDISYDQPYDEGPMVVYEPSNILTTWQFPQRSITISGGSTGGSMGPSRNAIGLGLGLHVGL